MTGKLVEIGKAIAQARANLPEELEIQAGHRLDRKIKEVDLALATAAGMRIRAFTDGGDLRPGQDIVVKTIVDAPEAVAVESVASPAKRLKTGSRYPLPPMLTSPIRSTSSSIHSAATAMPMCNSPPISTATRP